MLKAIKGAAEALQGVNFDSENCFNIMQQQKRSSTLSFQTPRSSSIIVEPYFPLLFVFGNVINTVPPVELCLS